MLKIILFVISFQEVELDKKCFPLSFIIETEAEVEMIIPMWEHCIYVLHL